MAGMQRFVTYLYSYKGNEKLQNTGFAKVEIRGGQCRLEIHLKGAFSPEALPGVYLFSREGEMIHAVEIGSLSLSSGGGDCKVMLQSGKVADSPYSIYDMKGIFIPLDDSVMFASQWDDGEIARERIRIWRPEETTEREQVQETEEISAEGKAEEETSGKETVTGADIEEKQAEPSVESEDVKTETSKQQREEPVSAGEGETVADAGAASVQATEIPIQEQAAGKDLPQKTLLDCFLKLQKREQTIEIFETGKRQVSGIHIELRDIRELPRKFWNLGNNSFLLHGFFNYHYLLLGKRTEGDKELIFVGVPGIFHSQERIMASLFGFSEFLPGRQKEEKATRGFQEIDSQEQLLETLQAAELKEKSDRQFGYWCHFMMD